MQLRAENQNLVSALSNYQQILYQFFDFTQNLKQSHFREEIGVFFYAIDSTNFKKNIIYAINILHLFYHSILKLL